MSVELFVPFCAKALNSTPEQLTPTRGEPNEISQLLWFMMKPLQELPVDRREQLNGAAYDPNGEAEFDSMLESMEADPTAEFSVKTLAAATVWQERLKQALVVLQSNQLAGAKVIVPPREMPQHLRQMAAALLWLHQMKLPFKPGTSIPQP